MANSRILIWLLVLTSLAISPISKASEWLHYFPASDSEAQQGFVRITNLSGIAGTVAISGTDDAGITSSGIVELSLDIDESIHINSQEIENGSTSKGLIGNLDDGSGAWRLYFSTDLDLAITGLFRNESGFVNTIHSTAKSSDGLRHTVSIFLILRQIQIKPVGCASSILLENLIPFRLQALMMEVTRPIPPYQ